MDRFNSSKEPFWDAHLKSEPEVVNALLADLRLPTSTRDRIKSEAMELANKVRQNQPTGLMSPFLVEYGLSTNEGIALMCLAEALLRVPDIDTVDALISDKLSAADWGRHLGHSSSSLVNASTWALMLTGKVLTKNRSEDIAETMRAVLRRLGEPVVRLAVAKAIELIADQFILGQDINAAVIRGQNFVNEGYRYSYDMLGESALTRNDAQRYWDSYKQAINFLAQHCHSEDVRENPGISVKLSAIHPRYHSTHRSHSTDEIVASTLDLARAAKQANMGFNIDAEEFEKLYISLDVIERVLADPSLSGWNGFGVVVQAYSPYAIPIIDWLSSVTQTLDRKIMLRLVKGAYWDTEIKRAQVLGLTTYPVYTRKSSTDLSYLVCTQRLFELNDHIYPQFATHNVHTIRSVLAMANESGQYEFQRLHGMGEEVHQVIREAFGYRCRIYAPVGAHQDLLAYLVRRILENGANSSFVHQLMDHRVPAQHFVTDPVTCTNEYKRAIANPAIPLPRNIFGKSRLNSIGIDLANDAEFRRLTTNMEQFSERRWIAKPYGYNEWMHEHIESRYSPVDTNLLVGQVLLSEQDYLPDLIGEIAFEFDTWKHTSAKDRATILGRIAKEYEIHWVELVVLMIRETGKTIVDAVAEVREAIDFCRYYANAALALEKSPYSNRARGVNVCISPWNFPLAIFTGQIVGALAAGNSVIAKPAEQSPLVAARAMQLMNQAGVPFTAGAIVYGPGESIGASLVSSPRIASINFTGSTETARLIHRSMAQQGNPLASLVAETGGLNAMIVDSTALPEQVVRDILVSAFQSVGQRCSALRMLYIQEQIVDQICDMLFGAMDELVIGDPWNLETDIGPLIDAEAKRNIDDYIQKMKAAGSLRHQIPLPNDLNGHFVSPCVIEVSGIEELEREIFGPVLHFTSYQSDELPAVIESVNRSGYGLTFGLHSRIDQRVQQITESINTGNIYVNRNQIGAVVGCQPFGGRGLSGTGPKAGGPLYVPNLRQYREDCDDVFRGKVYSRGNTHQELTKLHQLLQAWSRLEDRATRLGQATADQPDLYEACQQIFELIDSPVDLDSPTGESNRLYLQAKGIFVCIGSPLQVIQALAAGNAVLAVDIDSALIDRLLLVDAPILASPMIPDATSLASGEGIAGIAFEHCDQDLVRELRSELANLDGPIIQFITDRWAPWQFVAEKTLCIDTTAAGGNAQLLVEAGS